MNPQRHRWTLTLGLCLVTMLLTGANCGTSALAAPPGTSGFVYIRLGGNQGVAASLFNGSTGQLSPIAGSPFMVGMQVRELAWDEDGKRLFVADEVGAIHVSKCTPTGALGAPVSTIVPSLAGQYHARLAYLAGFLYSTAGQTFPIVPISQFRVNVDDTLTPLANPTSNISGLDPVGLNGMLPTLGRLLCFGTTGGALCQVRTPDSSGNLTTGFQLGPQTFDSACPSGDGAIAFLADRDKVTSVQLANPTVAFDSVTTALTINDYTLIAADPLGRAIYVVGDGVESLAYVPTSGATFGTPSAAIVLAGAADWLAADDSGKWLFVTSNEASFVRVYRINTDGSIGAQSDNKAMSAVTSFVYAPL